MKEQYSLTPAQVGLWRRAKKIILILLAIILVIVIYFVSIFTRNSPVDYADIEEHFKYGSIGSEIAGGMPYWIFKVLPEMFPDKGYESIGLIYEEGKDLPIGVSQRNVSGVDIISFNCAICHTGTIRETPISKPQIVLGMPANKLNFIKISMFLQKCALDARFTPDEFMLQIEKAGGDLGFIDRFLYRNVIVYLVREGFIGISFAHLEGVPEWGPGRVDTFIGNKINLFGFPIDKLDKSELIGAADLPSIWNQELREGMQLHWDGNNTSVEERNKSAALATGVTPPTLDLDRLKRIEDWLLKFKPPAYPYEINENLAAKGQQVYKQNCASCHDFDGSEVGTVVPIDKIGTDPHRLNSYTYEFAVNQNTLYAGYPWRLKNFRKTNGYANMPLEGIWLRAPYLHNGSVPTLRDLLEAPEKRPKVFYRGYDVIDMEKVGFIYNVSEENGHQYFRYDTSLPGNGNGGHLYGTGLTPEEKNALVEYMKKL